MEYLKDENKREASLENILQFCTGLKRVPPMGLKDPITIKYLFTSPLPMAEHFKYVTSRECPSMPIAINTIFIIDKKIEIVF